MPTEPVHCLSGQKFNSWLSPLSAPFFQLCIRNAYRTMNERRWLSPLEKKKVSLPTERLSSSISSSFLASVSAAWFTGWDPFTVANDSSPWTGTRLLCVELHSNPEDRSLFTGGPCCNCEAEEHAPLLLKRNGRIYGENYCVSNLTSCAGTTCHVRREHFVPKLQHFLGFKYIETSSRRNERRVCYFLIIPRRVQTKKKATNCCIRFGHSLWSAQPSCNGLRGYFGNPAWKKSTFLGIFF